jgi:hypothetical protein
MSDESDLTVVGKVISFLFPKIFKTIRLMVFMYIVVPAILLLALLFRIFTHTPDMKTLWESLKNVGEQFNGTYEHAERYGGAGDWILLNIFCLLAFGVVSSGLYVWGWG